MIKLDNKAKVMATTNACPNRRRGNNAERLSTAKPPAVVRAAPAMARPVVAVDLATHSSGAQTADAPLFKPGCEVNGVVNAQAQREGTDGDRL